MLSVVLSAIRDRSQVNEALALYEVRDAKPTSMVHTLTHVPYRVSAKIGPKSSSPPHRTRGLRYTCPTGRGKKQETGDSTQKRGRT